MANGIYCGIGGVVKKVKKAYVGVGGVVKKVKKAYVGVGGVPKITYSDGLTYVGTIASELTSASGQINWGVGFSSTHILIPTAGTQADVLDTNFLKSQVPSSNHSYGMGGNISKYAVLAGGYYTGSANEFEAFDNLLTKITKGYYGTKQNLSASISSPTYLVFAGGQNDNDHSNYGSVFNSSLTETTLPALSNQVMSPIGAYIGQYLLIAGGTPTDYVSNAISYVNAYTIGLTKVNAQNMQYGRGFNNAGISTKNYAIFCKGDNVGADAYDSSLTRLYNPMSTKSSHGSVCISCPDYGMVAGGNSGNGTEIETYDSNFVHDISDQVMMDIVPSVSSNPIPIWTYYSGGVKFGNYFVVTGGELCYQNGGSPRSNRKVHIFEY